MLRRRSSQPASADLGSSYRFDVTTDRVGMRGAHSPRIHLISDGTASLLWAGQERYPNAAQAEIAGYVHLRNTLAQLLSGQVEQRPGARPVVTSRMPAQQAAPPEPQVPDGLFDEIVPPAPGRTVAVD